MDLEHSKEKYTTLLKSCKSEEDFIRRTKARLDQQSNRYSLNDLEIILDLTLILVDKQPDDKQRSHDFQTIDDQTSLDADDEGDDDIYIFPCHIVFDDCHPDLLTDYHKDRLKNIKTPNQLIKYPKICEFTVDSMLQIVRRLIQSDINQEVDDLSIVEEDEVTKSIHGFLQSIMNMIDKLNKVCTLEKKNCRILSKTNIISIILYNIQYFLQKIPDYQQRYLERLLKFVLTIADYKIAAEDLKQLFNILKDENIDLKATLSHLEGLLNHHYKNLRNIQPIRSINFPSASLTGEEIESDQYLSNSWHWRLRSKVIEFKKKQARNLEAKIESQNLETSKQDYDINLDGEKYSTGIITPSWLECSIMTPLSNISPIAHSGGVQFCCSMWISVCGDLFVVDSSTKHRSGANSVNQFVDKNWRNIPGHWQRLTSRRRLYRRFSNQVHCRRERSHQQSSRRQKRLAHDDEDEKQEEDEAKSRKSEFKHFASSHSFITGSTTSFRHLAGRKSIYKEPMIDKSRASSYNSASQPPKEFLGRRARDNQQELLMHLVSFALDTLTIEIWLNVRTMTFCARACRVAREGQTNLIDQVTFPSHLEARGNWSHLMFYLDEESRGSEERMMNLRVLVDGIHKEKEKLIYQNPRSPLTNFACLIGCERSIFGYVWKLSQINIYRSVPSKNVPIYLLGKGPDFWSITNFRYDSTLTLPDITQRFIKNLMDPRLLELYSNVDEEHALNWLTKNTVIAYRSSQPDFFLDYSTNQMSSSIINSLSADHEYNNSSERFIQASVLNFSRSMKFNTNSSIGASLVRAGGIESVLILFADIVRRAQESSSTIHSLAFSILLKMSQTNQHHLNKFLDDINGLKLVEFILNHPKCLVSRSMLEHYFEFAIMRRGDCSLIKSPKLVYHLLNCWHAWHKDIKVAKLFYRKLIKLLRPSDSSSGSKPEDRRLESFYINHNFRMMAKAGALDILMNILRTCLVPIDHQFPKINHELIELIVNLLSLLIKHPPGLDVISEIMEFLTFLHPDPKAYIDTTLDKLSHLHLIRADSRDTNQYDGNASRTIKTSIADTPSSYRSSSDNGHQLSSGSNIDISRRSLSRVTVDTTSSNYNLKDQESVGLDRYINQYNVDLNTVTDNCLALDKIGDINRRTEIEIDREDDQCNNRNYAIANIADVLASIVKLSLTDQKKILTTALEKPVIDIHRLIILANNESSFVREKVLRLFLYSIRACYSLNLRSVLDRHEEDTRGSNYSMCTPIQLFGRQLLKYPTTMKMIQMCYGIIVGIEDFETVDKVCLIFDFETIDNNLKLNTLILLIKLMTQLQSSEEITTSLEFIYSYMKKLLELNRDDILSIIVKSNLVECLLRLYFRYVEYESTRWSKLEQIHQNYDNDDEESKSDYSEVWNTFDKTLILITRYYLQNQNTEEAIKSIEDLLLYFNLMNTYVPAKFQSLLRDRGVKVLTTALNYCEHYEDCARQRSRGWRVEYYLKSLFTNKNMNFFPNTISNSRLDQESIFTKSSSQDRDDVDFDCESRDISVNSAIETESNGYGKPDYEENIEPTQYSTDDNVLEKRTLNEKDVVDRHKSTLDLSINFITNREPEIIPSPLERKFIMKCISMMSDNLIELERTTSPDKSRSHWSLILPKLEQTMKQNFSRLILYLLSPCESMSLDERKYYALKLLDMFSIDQLLSLLHSSDQTSYMLLNLFVKDLINAESSTFNSEDEDSEIEEFMDDDTELKLRMLISRTEHELCLNSKNRNLRGIQYRNWMRFSRNDTVTRLDLKLRDIWMTDLNQAREDMHEKIALLKESLSDGENNMFTIFADQIKRINDDALEITRAVVDDKHKLRKTYLEDIKHNKVYDYLIRQQWLSIIIGNTHERAIWYMDTHYPKSWELNPVEGPSRIRRRLRPCKLRIEDRFLRRIKQHLTPEPENLKKIGSTSQNDPLAYDWYNHYSPHPLCSMIVEQEQEVDSSELRIRMFTTDAIHFNCDCRIVRPNEVCEGEISIATWCLHFIGKPGFDSHHQWPTIVEDLWFDEILEIWDRRYQLQDVGLEIFLTNNMTYLLSFDCDKDREDFKQVLMREPNKSKMINLQRFNLNSSLNRMTQLWREGRLTNFDYITCLNKLAGRSFNDLMQYPVFPFILSNYSTNNIDLNMSSNFRDLKKPMAIQNPEKELTFTSNYEASQATGVHIGSGIMSRPYHYGNHYSNSATVLHFLVRLPPFTQMLIQYQDNNFDQPDRTFHSVASTWQLITRDSNTDFKELIPEFFYLPEMFLNFEKFDLGRKQNDELVDDVKLPAWCPNSDPRMFVLIHRQALESANVSENLHHWIDLIFGFKQTGRPAVEAMNVFHPATYYGAIDLSGRQSYSNISGQLTSTVASISAKLSTYGSDHLSTGNTNFSDLDPSDSGSSNKKLSYHNNLYQNDIERMALETMIRTYGQMPRQLFAQPIKQRSFSTFAPQINNSRLIQQDSKNDQLFKRLEPIKHIKGLRWGSYVGSPDESDITAIKLREIAPKLSSRPRLKREYHDQTWMRHAHRFNICLLPNGEVAILKNHTSLILDYRADRKSGGGYQLSLPQAKYSRRAGRSNVARMNSFSNMIISRQQFAYSEPYFSATHLDSAHGNPSLMSLSSTKPKFSHKSLSLVSWSYLDGTVRVRHPAFDNQKPSLPLVQADSIVDSVSTCTSIPQLNLLLVGYMSGAICAHIVSTSHSTAPIHPHNSLTSHDISAKASLGNSAAPSAVHFLHLANNFSTSSSSSDNAGLGENENVPISGDQYPALSLAGKTLHNVRSTNKTTRWLYCHSNKITCMKIDVNFGIVVSASDDGTSVVWDLNTLTYVRTLSYKPQKQINNSTLLDYLCNCDDIDFVSSTDRASSGISESNDRYNKDNNRDCICKSSVNLIAISETLGDIVTVKDINNRLASTNELGTSEDDINENKQSTSSLSTISDASTSSILYVHTINGRLVGCANCHSQITAVCYSNAPEGISINVIVVGLADGLIRLYSSWDLSRIKEFKMSDLCSPITSLLYSHDNQLLYIAYEDGQLVVLRNKKKTGVTLPKEWFL